MGNDLLLRIDWLIKRLCDVSSWMLVGIRLFVVRKIILFGISFLMGIFFCIVFILFGLWCNIVVVVWIIFFSVCVVLLVWNFC